METQAKTKPVGRILRLLVGAAFLVWAIPPSGAPVSAILLSLATAVVLLIFYLMVYWALIRYVGGLSNWLGVLVAAGPVGLVFFLGLPGRLIFGRGEGALAVLVYIGVSLIVMAVRADPGCEVMTLPNLIFGKDTRLPCFLFSPIDAIERKVRGHKGEAVSQLSARHGDEKQQTREV